MYTTINEFRKIFENNNLYSADFIINYITQETEYAISIHEDEDVMPNYFLDIIKNDNCQYELKQLKIEDILNNDSDVKDYVLGANDRYEDLDLDYSRIDNPIVIHKNQVFDGYNRLLIKYNNGEIYINTYINI